ncbi:hypothetical protein [Nonomuraea sp. NPDC048916]|uniref:hypothetical protein n=1 Tax=Nonomuraea sp. NPDC048916 TaxID=3154232 RepID=UPI0033CFA5BA
MPEELPDQRRVEVVRVGSGISVIGKVPHGAGGHRTAELSVDVFVTPQGNLSSRYRWDVTLDPDTSAHILHYQPSRARLEWPHVAQQVQMLVAALGPLRRDKVARALTSTAHLAMWCHRHGLGNDPEVWFSAETIGAFVRDSCSTLTRDAAQEYQTWLRHMRTTLAWAGHGPHSTYRTHCAHGTRGGQRAYPVNGLPRPSAPYSRRQLSRLRLWAEKQSDRVREDCLTLMALAYGGGLRQEELQKIRGDEIRILDNGMAVFDAIHLGRIIVARAAWQEYLADIAGRAGNRRLYRPRRTTARTTRSGTTQRPLGALPALSARRLRATWIVELLSAGIDGALVADVAGLSLARLETYRQFVATHPR